MSNSLIVMVLVVLDTCPSARDVPWPCHFMNVSTCATLGSQIEDDDDDEDDYEGAPPPSSFSQRLR